MNFVKSLAVEQFADISIIRFIRPEIKNPLSLQTLDELEQSFISSASRAIILTGSGDTFAAGANLNEINSLTKDTAREFARRGQALMQTIYNSDKLTIAAINGYCFGGALDLALSCKQRIASPTAVFCHPGVSLGIITGWGGTQMLPRLIGEAKALELFLTARRVSAKEAYQIGLVDKIADNPLKSACEIAESSKLE